MPNIRGTFDTSPDFIISAGCFVINAPSMSGSITGLNGITGSYVNS